MKDRKKPYHKILTGLHFGFQDVILLLMFLFLTIVIVYPLIMIVINSLKYDNSYSIIGYINVFRSLSNMKSLINSLKLSFVVLLGTWVIGGTLSFLRSNTDFRYKKLMDFFVFLSFAIPPYVVSIAWIELTSRGGYINRILQMFIPTIKYLSQTYSLKSTALILIIHLYPLVYLGLSNALSKINSDLVNSARVSGANSIRIIYTIIIPLLFPSFISTGLLVISRTMANFEVPCILALPVGESVLTTQIFSAISQLKLNLASILSIVLIFINFLFFIVVDKKLNKRFQFSSKNNKNQSANNIKLGKLNVFINSLVAIFFTCTFIVPMITIFLSSFLKRWGISFCFQNLTINNYRILFFQNDTIRKSLVNSIIYGLVSATIAVFIASIVIYLYKNNKRVKYKALFNISQLSIACPNIILAIGAIFAWINEPIKLYGTKWIIIVTYIALFIPIAIKQIKGISDNISDTMDKSAMTMGINVMKRFKDIFFPYVKDGLISGWLLCFMIAMKEVSISLLLYAKGTETIGVMLFTVQSNSYGLEMTSCISIIVIVISIIGNFIVRRIDLRRSI